MGKRGADNLLDEIGLQVQLHRAGFEIGDIKQVGDDTGKPIGFLVDGAALIQR